MKVMKAGWKHGLGLAAAMAAALASHVMTAPAVISQIHARADAALDGAGGRGVTARFTTVLGLYTRHPRLETDRVLTGDERTRLAAVVAHQRGVGGVRWASAPGLAEARASPSLSPDHCQKDVEGLLHVRTIRFDEGSARIDPASLSLIDEVAEALRPCAGSRIAISGHTDPVGDEAANVALSLRRAEAVRDQLVRRGLSPTQLVAKGLGSAEPVEGLLPDDPANRRIEFSVLSTASVRPTPIDLPVSQ